MARHLQLGDLVARRDRPAADAGQHLEVAIVVEMRRNDCRVFVPETGEGSWIEKRNLSLLRIIAGKRSIPAKISRLLHDFDAIECELHPMPDDRFRLDISHLGMTLELLDQVRRFMREDLLDLKIEPQGMGAIRTIIEFR